MRETNCYNNLDEIPPSIRKVQTVLFRVNFAPWTASPPTDNYPVQCPVSTRDTNEDVQGKSPSFTIVHV